jgi:parallel beta-helix repeat protein
MGIIGAIAVMFCLPLAGACLSTTPAEAAQVYTPHDVIQIDGDSDFVAENGITEGQGTEEDPYIIEGWVINASLAAGSAGGIQISHTDAHFKIRNVRVEFGGALYTGIWLSNVRNASVEDSMLVDNYEGITLNSTVSLTIRNNTLMNNSFSGVYARASEYVNIELNEITGSRYGVYSDSCEQVQIVDNAISDNEHGVYLYASSFNMIWNNTFTGNNGAGSTYDSDHIQAYDDGATNWWNSTDGYGNYWSDWTAPDDDFNGIVDSPYDIDGSAGAKDFYPLVSPLSPNHPIASFAVSPSIGDMSTVFSVDASSSSDLEDDVANLTFRWDWENDGVWDTIWSTDTTELHQYAEEGEYTIRLEVKDTDALTDSTTKQIIVDETPPAADAGADQDVAEDTIVALDGSGSTDNIGIANYSWSFIEIIDGNEVETYLMGEQTPIVFENPGEYIITLMVVDFTGLWDTDDVTVRVADITPPTADAGPDQTVDEDTLVTFDGSDSSDNVDIVNYTWTFTDGTAKTLYGVSPTYAFETPGTYTITLNVTDAPSNWGTDGVTITVNDATIPSANAGPDQTADEDTLVTFDGSGSSDNVGIVNYTWTFTYEGYTVELYGEEPTFKFEKSGTYNVTLTVKDAANLTDTDMVKITVNERAGISMLAVGAIGIIIVAIVALAVFVMIRKKKPPHET